MGWELEAVEKPFVEELVAMGWRYVAGHIDTPAATGRSSFLEVVQEATLRRQLHALNQREADSTAQPWPNETRMAQAVAALTPMPAPRLMEANGTATALLL